MVYVWRRSGVEEGATEEREADAQGGGTPDEAE